MGRNAGSKIFWTVASDGTYLYTWYCQQHSMWDQTGTFTKLQEHLETHHGCVEQ